MEFLRKIFKSTIVTPVAKQERCNCHVIICGARTMESHGACEAVWILERVVAMIPRCTILSDSELVGETVPRSNWALGDSIDAILFE